MELRGKVAVISGSSRGIGKAIALALADEGVKVIVNYFRSREKAEEVLREIRKKGSEGIMVKADVSDYKQAEFLIEEAVKAFGTIHILIHCAGIYGKKPLIDMSFEEWDRMIKVHLYSAYNLVKHALPHMVRVREGVIVIISSQKAIRPAANIVHYSAAKAGLIAFTKSLALELAPYNIRVNSVAPGPIDTDLLRQVYGGEEGVKKRGRKVPLGRVGKPEEVADAALALIKNDFITGAVLLVDGGSSLA